MQPSLFISSGKQQGSVVSLAQLNVAFGRSSANHVQLLDKEVSRRHFEIFHEHGSYWIRDLASNNGTFVNGVRVSFSHLKTGDQIRVGQTEMLFTGPPEAGNSIENDILVHLVDDHPPGFQDSIADKLAVADVADLSNSSHTPGVEDVSPWQFVANLQGDLDFVHRVFQSVSQSLDEREVYQRVLDQIFDWVKADRACVVIFDPESNDMIVTLAKLREPSPDRRMRVSRSILEYVRSKQQGILTHNARDDQRWGETDSSVSAGVHDAICVPLLGSQGFLGAIYVDTAISLKPRKHNRNAFTEDQLKIMMTVGSHAALAVECARHYSALVNQERMAAIGQTIASLSHHIKNILQGINSGTYLLEQGLNASNHEDTQRGWGIVKKYQESISQLVLDMLSFSKDREPVRDMKDLNAIVSASVDLIRPRATSLKIELEWRPAPGLPGFEFDGHGLGHAITNLLQNAIDACGSRTHSKILVAVGHNPALDSASIVVQDNGIGIPPEEIPRVFDLFHSTKGSLGTGLGLAVSQKIVREHGGEISVESKRDQGSRFVVSLPLNSIHQEPSTKVHPHFEGRIRSLTQFEI